MYVQYIISSWKRSLFSTKNIKVFIQDESKQLKRNKLQLKEGKGEMLYLMDEISKSSYNEL